MIARILSGLAGISIILLVLVARGLPLLLLAKSAVLLALLVFSVVLLLAAFSSDD